MSKAESRDSFPINEMAIHFDHEQTFLDSLATLDKVLVRNSVKYRILGGEGDRRVIVQKVVYAQLSSLLQQEGISFSSSRVQSMAELSPKDREILRRTGIKIG